LPIAATLSWFFISEKGYKIVSKNPISFLLLGPLLAIFTWTTYQTTFICIGLFISIGIDLLIKKNWKALINITLSGAILCLSFYILYIYIIKYTIAFAHPVPNWNGVTLPGDNIKDLITYPIRSAWAVSQNLLTFWEWGTGSKAITLVTFLITSLGIFLLFKRKSITDPEKRALLLSTITFITLITLSYLKLFALAETRHSYIFQIPLVIFILVGIKQFKPTTISTYATLILILPIATVGNTAYIKSTDCNVDFDYIQNLLSENQDTHIIDLVGDTSWDHMLFIPFNKDLRQRSHQWLFLKQDRKESWFNILQQNDTTILYSHRKPLNKQLRKKITTDYNLKVTTLKEIYPTGSAEFSTVENGGNGFFLYRVEKL